MEYELLVPSGVDIEKIIPHRRPFRFIDQILEVEFGRRATALLNDLSTPEYDWIRSHFPSYHLVPGVILLEALAEVGAVAVLGLSENRDKIAMLVGADNVRWRKEVRPGQIVRLETEITHMHSKFGKGYGRALLDDRILAAEGVITFYIADQPRS